MEEIKSGYARVTEVIAPFQDFSGINPDVLARKCKIGSEVHSAIESFYHEEFCPISSDAQEYMPAFKSAVNGELSTYTPILLEKRLYSQKLKITGQIDGIFESEGQKTLIDYKTTYAANTKVWRLQLAMYCMLISENKLCDEPKAKILHLKKKGTFALIDLTPSKEDYSLARAAIKLYWHFN